MLLRRPAAARAARRTAPRHRSGVRDLRDLRTSTPTGHYWIQGRVRNTSLTLISGASYAVKYWIPFDAPLFGFHDSSWQHFRYGSPRYKTAGSHGCVHMPLRAIAFLYRWAARPTRVRIT